ARSAGVSSLSSSSLSSVKDSSRASTSLVMRCSFLRVRPSPTRRSFSRTVATYVSCAFSSQLTTSQPIGLWFCTAEQLLTVLSFHTGVPRRSGAHLAQQLVGVFEGNHPVIPSFTSVDNARFVGFGVDEEKEVVPNEFHLVNCFAHGDPIGWKFLRTNHDGRVLL